MVEFRSIAMVFIYFGAFLAVLRAAMEYIKGGAGPFFWLLVLLASSISRTGWYLSETPAQYPWLTLFFFATVLTAGPLTYRIFLDMTAYLSQKQTLPNWHFIPAAAAVVIDIGFRLQPTAEQTRVLGELLAGTGAELLQVAFVFVGVHSGAYLLAVIYRIRKLDSEYEIPHVWAAYMMLMVPLAGSTIATAGHFTNLVVFCTGGLLMTLTLVLMFLLSAKYPAFFTTLESEVKRKRYERTQLSGVDLPAVERRLHELLYEEKIYKQEELRMPLLAEELLITPHQLSRILNEKYKKTFNDLINEYRIKEAKELLLANPKQNILLIAYECGYNNKATFNDQFSRHTGMTPSAYRKSAG